HDDPDADANRHKTRNTKLERITAKIKEQKNQMLNKVFGNKPVPRTARNSIIIWLAFVLVFAVIIVRSTFTTDLSAFLPRDPTLEQQLLMDQLRDGLVSR